MTSLKATLAKEQLCSVNWSLESLLGLATVQVAVGYMNRPHACIWTGQAVA